jgi:hypothetical protein
LDQFAATTVAMSGGGKGGLSLALPAASHKLLRALTGPTETKEMPASASSNSTQSAQNLPAGSAPYSFALSNLLTMPPPPSPRNPGDKTFVDLHFMLGKYDEFMSRGELLHLLRARCARFHTSITFSQGIVRYERGTREVRVTIVSALEIWMEMFYARDFVSRGTRKIPILSLFA